MFKLFSLFRFPLSNHCRDDSLILNRFDTRLILYIYYVLRWKRNVWTIPFGAVTKSSPFLWCRWMDDVLVLKKKRSKLGFRLPAVLLRAMTDLCCSSYCFLSRPWWASVALASDWEIFCHVLSTSDCRRELPPVSTSLVLYVPCATELTWGRELIAPWTHVLLIIWCCYHWRKGTRISFCVLPTLSRSHSLWMASNDSLPKPAPTLVDANSSKEHGSNCTGCSVKEILQTSYWIASSLRRNATLPWCAD